MLDKSNLFFLDQFVSFFYYIIILFIICYYRYSSSSIFFIIIIIFIIIINIYIFEPSKFIINFIINGNIYSSYILY